MYILIVRQTERKISFTRSSFLFIFRFINRPIKLNYLTIFYYYFLRYLIIHILRYSIKRNTTAIIVKQILCTIRRLTVQAWKRNNTAIIWSTKRPDPNSLFPPNLYHRWSLYLSASANLPIDLRNGVQRAAVHSDPRENRVKILNEILERKEGKERGQTRYVLILRSWRSFQWHVPTMGSACRGFTWVRNCGGRGVEWRRGFERARSHINGGQSPRRRFRESSSRITANGSIVVRIKTRPLVAMEIDVMPDDDISVFPVRCWSPRKDLKKQ